MVAPPAPPASSSSPRRLVLVVFDGVQGLDVSGPAEVLHSAGHLSGSSSAGLSLAGSEFPPTYRIVVASVGGGWVSTSSGLSLATESLPCATGIDTLIVAGGVGVADALRDGELLDWLRRAAPRTRKVASVCTGAFLLAEIGLLDGRRVTTHWAACAELARRYPRVEVDPEPIYTSDGGVYTSAGVTAGMDLALALVEEDLGRELALRVARQLVLFLRRPGSQAQFSVQLAGQIAEDRGLMELQGWMADHPGADLSVEALAGRVCLSPRHFARLFHREVGVTPGRYVEALRLEVARRRLEETQLPVERLADDCGFGTGETMRRTFLRRLGVSPTEYRRRFAPSAAITS